LFFYSITLQTFFSFGFASTFFFVYNKVITFLRIKTKKTAPLDVSNSTKQVDSNHLFNQECNCNLLSIHVRWPRQTSGAFGLALIFLVLFASRQKERKVKKQIYVCMFFLLLVQKKNQRKAHRQ